MRYFWRESASSDWQEINELGYITLRHMKETKPVFYLSIEIYRGLSAPKKDMPLVI